MKQKWFRGGALLMGAAFLMLFGMLSCQDPNSEPKDGEKFTVNFKLEDPSGKAKLTAMESSNEVKNGAKVEKGKKVKFTLSGLDSEYQIKSWMDGATKIAENTSMTAEVTVTKDVNVVVTLEKKTAKPKFAVNFKLEDPSGKAKLTAMEGSNNVVSGNQVEQGKKVIFTLSGLDSEYQIKSWMDGATKIAENTSMTAEVTVTKEVNVVVTLEKKTAKPKFAVNFSVDPSGKATITAKEKENQNPVQSAGQVEKGKTVTFTLTNLDNEYEVKEWKNGSNKIADKVMTVDVAVDAEVNIVVTLEKKMP